MACAKNCTADACRSILATQMVYDTANSGGVSADGTTFPKINAGFDANQIEDRGVVSFNVPGVPINSIVESAKLSFQVRSSGASDVFSVLGPLQIVTADYTAFGSSACANSKLNENVTSVSAFGKVSVNVPSLVGRRTAALTKVQFCAYFAPTSGTNTASKGITLSNTGSADEVQLELIVASPPE